jgi:hypothetical protein
MSRFNAARKIGTENLAGGKAYRVSEKMKLATFVLTSFVKDQYYRSEKENFNEIKKLISSVKDKEFVAKTAIYARNEFGMRTITHIIAGEIAKAVKGAEWTKRFYDKMIHRVDDITEVISYYLNAYGKPIPNSLRKGLKKAFDKFDGYQLAKYRAENKDVKLVDAVNLLRPRGTRKNEEALKQLVGGRLRSKDTWESKLTQAGQRAETEEGKSELKEKVWKDLVLEKKIGYFALLRNLRNILEQSPGVLDAALELLVDENMIKKSLVMPFRFTTAMGQLRISHPNERKVLNALSEAVDISCNNVPKLDGDTLVVCDYSGSMGGCVEDYKGIATLFGAVLAKSNDADFMIFGNNAAYVSYNSQDSTMTIFGECMRHNSHAGDGLFVGHGTNFHSIFDKAHKGYKRIFIFSDMQGWIGHDSPVRAFELYKNKYSCDPYVYSIDLSGYGTAQLPEQKVFMLAGFSEKIFDVIKLFEKDRDALISEIEKVEL